MTVLEMMPTSVLRYRHRCHHGPESLDVMVVYDFDLGEYLLPSLSRAVYTNCPGCDAEFPADPPTEHRWPS